jgi:16S rRNA (cytosine967-C5)-methyltransferase
MSADPRSVALSVLRRVFAEEAYSDLALSAALDQSSFASADRRLIAELVYGVLRNRTYLDWHIDRVSRRQVKDMEFRVADALRLGAYQLLFLDRIPAYAAVNETVNLVPRRAAGLVNAILRRLPCGADGRINPSSEDPLHVAAIRYSHPRWLLDLCAEQFGVEATLAIARAEQERPAAVARINPLNTTREQLLAELASLNARATRHSPWGVEVDHLDELLRHAAFRDGRCFVQSEASQIVGELVGAQEGETVLDVCAAPGGKATHLAALVGERGRVVAGDVHPHRLRLLRGNLRRLGIRNVFVAQLDATRPLELGDRWKSFDRVLVDAPCTALGTLTKNPELRWRVKREDPERLAAVQLALLLHAAETVRPG